MSPTSLHCFHKRLAVSEGGGDTRGDDFRSPRSVARATGVNVRTIVL